MQAVAEVVSRQLVLLASHRQFALVDAVGIASYGRAKVARTVHRICVLLQVVISEHYVRGSFVLVGNHKRYHTAAEVCDAHLNAVVVFKGVEFHGLAVDGRVESRWVETRYGQV